MQISERLTAVAGLVTPGKVLADVGTDHGYVPIYLVQKQVVERAIAMDVRKGPLSRAMEHVAAYSLEGKIETRLSDGLEALVPGEADRIVIAGMGGALVVRILEAGADKILDETEMVIQPQSELGMVREWLCSNHYRILEEEMIWEDGKFYPMMRIQKLSDGQMELSVLQKKYGPLLLERKHPVLIRFLEQEQKKLDQILKQMEGQNSDSVLERIPELKKEQLYVYAALELCEGSN